MAESISADSSNRAKADGLPPMDLKDLKELNITRLMQVAKELQIPGIAGLDRKSVV